MSTQGYPFSRDEAVRLLETEYGFSGKSIYLLELIPLIEMLWADGANQEAEIRLVKQFALRHAVEVAEAAGGPVQPWVEEANRFVNFYISNRPPAGLLSAVRSLAGPVIVGDEPRADQTHRARNILEYCMDIAAAAVTSYPYGRRDRFMEEEKKVLLDLMADLDISPERPAPAL